MHDEARREDAGLDDRKEWPHGEKWLCNCIVMREGKLLMLQRAPGDFMGGLWDLPGGKLDPGEDPQESARRELLEEAGLRALQLLEYAHYTTPELKSDADRFHIVTYVVSEADSQAEVQLSEEHPNFRWVTKEEFEELDVVSYVRRALVDATW